MHYKSIVGLVLVTLMMSGCSSEKAADTEELFVITDGKADNFFSLSAQEYTVEGTTYVELEAEYDDEDDEARKRRVLELVYYRQIAVNWFLLQFLMGIEDDHDNKFESLTKNGSYEDLEITQDPENARLFTFRFRQEIGGQLDLLAELPSTVEADGFHHFQLPVGKVPNSQMEMLELNKEWYRKSPWSKFNPTTAGEDKVEHIDLTIKPEARSQDGWIDYDGLMADGELSISIHFGWDYHKEYHIVHSTDVYNWLVGKGFASPVGSYDEYLRDSGPLTRTLKANGKEIAVKVWLYWGKPGTETDPDTDSGGKALEEDMLNALATRDVIVFSGHSGPFYGFALANWRKTDEGDIDDSEIPAVDMPADRYQVVLAEGCDTYAMGQAFRINPNKEGLHNLDVLTTTNFSNASTAGVVRNMILALIEDDNQGRHKPWKFSDLLRKLDGNSSWFHSMYGVHGVDDNPRLHPYAVVESFCKECSDDADCGDNGNQCVRINDNEKVCSAECITTDACPAGYECLDVGQGGYSYIKTRLCIPLQMTCTSEPEAVVQAVMINEFLADPPADESGDANGDGKRDGVQDEFIELVSLSASPVDLGGWSVQDGFGTRFTFLAGTDLMPGRALLVFGGEDGAIRDFAADFGAEVFVADGLGLNNDGDSLFLVDPDGTVIDTLTYGAEGGDNRSLTRATDGDPDAPFIPHPGDSPFSPGTRANGDLF
jgi:hypothetical protein